MGKNPLGQSSTWAKFSLGNVLLGQCSTWAIGAWAKGAWAKGAWAKVTAPCPTVGVVTFGKYSKVAILGEKHWLNYATHQF